MYAAIAAREKRFTVREFVFEASKAADEGAKKAEEQEEYNRLQRLLINWLASAVANTQTRSQHISENSAFYHPCTPVFLLIRRISVASIK